MEFYVSPFMHRIASKSLRNKPTRIAKNKQLPILKIAESGTINQSFNYPVL
jgi:hypothetical protein